MTAEQLRRNMPPLREKELRRLNGLFQAHIFKNAAGDVWTSCCGQHRNYTEQKTLTPEEQNVWYARHVPAPKKGWNVSEFDREEERRRVRCPYCGAEATVKELRYSGERKNLWEYRRGVLLRQWRGAVWAEAYALTKSYRCSSDPVLLGRVLTALPEYQLLGIYRFVPGAAECATKSWWNYSDTPNNYRRQTALQKGKKRWAIKAPYGYCSDYGIGYEVVGTEELAKGPFRYCGLDELAEHCDMIKLLTAACLYPRQIEWLRKLGLEEAVTDLVQHGVKNHPTIKWDAKTPREFIDVSVKEILQIRDCPESVQVLKLYQSLPKPRDPSQIDACEELWNMLYDKRAVYGIWARTAKRGILPKKLIGYLKKECLKGQSLQDIAQIYADYLRAGEKIGLDLDNPIMLMPKNLNEKHDNATAAWAAMQDAKKAEAYLGLLKKLAKRYTYADGEYLIRPPIGGNEIKAEGKALRHCVGGYANRHLEGKTTILFLRRISSPKKPLCTIEMNGSRIVQIHGWDNERTPCRDNPEQTPCRTLYSTILTPWLKWLDGGSKRDKRGLPRKIKKQEAKTA